MSLPRPCCVEMSRMLDVITEQPPWDGTPVGPHIRKQDRLVIVLGQQAVLLSCIENRHCIFPSPAFTA